MYEGKIVNFVNLDVLSRRRAPLRAARASGRRGSTDVSVYRDIRPFKFEFCAWVLTEHDRWSSMGTLTFGPDSVAYDAPSRARSAPPTVSTARKGCRRLLSDLQPRWEEQGQRRLPLATTKMGGSSSGQRCSREVAVSLLANKRRQEAFWPDNGKSDSYDIMSRHRELQNRVDKTTRVPEPCEEAAERQGRETRQRRRWSLKSALRHQISPKTLCTSPLMSHAHAVKSGSEIRTPFYVEVVHAQVAVTSGRRSCP